MKVRVNHRTSYVYGEPVPTSVHEARLSPRPSATQRTLSHEITIEPRPATRQEHLDYFGNRTLHFSLREPHKTLEVVATSLVDLAPTSPPLLEATPAWEAMRDRIRKERRADLLEAYSFTFDSAHVKTGRGLLEYALPSFSPGRPLLAGIRDLTRRIHDDFAYDPEATDVSTPVDDVLLRRRGVCQDFAHLQIACLRSLGLAARYVSGYLLTHPLPGRPKLVGADASHAWIATFVPDWGWVEFDPTNDLMPYDEHVSMATGRDFGDVTPLKGIITGGGKHEVIAAVDVDVVP